jgi:hypothetical protein
MVRAANGNHALLTLLRAMAWDHYRQAGTPHGASEEGLAQWWDERISMWQN